MLVKQISIFVENKTGRLGEVIKILGNHDIDISALSIADTTDFGILRIIVNRPELAIEALKNGGVTVSATDVVAVAVKDEPGGLSAALDVLSAGGISVEYMYAFVGKKTNEALVIIKADEQKKVAEVLQSGGIRVLSPEQVYEL